MNLIIVESPTKAKTISKFLGKDYQVESSFGHVRDLPKSELGIDVDNNFTPRYVIPTKSRKTVSNLKSATKKSDRIILASDEDREGEAIAWHLAQILNLDTNQIERIVFHEITKDAILKALKHPRQINNAMVDAQQARRILDRLVGYKLSPFLWKKVAKGLSAGRVQSVTTRLIVERERAIDKFQPEEYWTITIDLKEKNKSEEFLANLYKISGSTFDKLTLKEKEAQNIKNLLKSANYSVDKITTKKINKNPGAPFTTSTLQQSANRHLGFSAKQTMTLAQKLYEQGFITYMRTDSLNLSPKFINESQSWLKKNLGETYHLKEGRKFKNKNKNAQEAHEAIRPSEVNVTPKNLPAKADRNQQKLYELIWQRAVASQMPAARLDTESIDIKAIPSKDNTTGYIFRATGQILAFDGYLKIWPEKTKEQKLPRLSVGQNLILSKLKTDKHSTNPPARYSDASLVKELEKYGIGRPSTYAPTIATIITRNYVSRDDNKRLKPTSIAFIVNDLLTKHFPKIVDYKFTAKMENDLDAVATGQTTWQPVISEFYKDFNANLQLKYEEINKNDIMPEEKSDEICDKCGSPMIIKTGRYGKFLACSAFPKCRNIKSLPGESSYPQRSETENAQLQELSKKYADTVCDKCGAPMKVKVGRYGPFLACSAFPKCRNIKNIESDQDTIGAIDCPVCGKGKIVKKFSRRGAFYACDNYPNCKNAYWDKPTGEKCPNCNALLVKTKTGQIKCSNKECDYKQ